MRPKDQRQFYFSSPKSCTVVRESLGILLVSWVTILVAGNFRARTSFALEHRELRSGRGVQIALLHALGLFHRTISPGPVVSARVGGRDGSCRAPALTIERGGERRRGRKVKPRQLSITPSAQSVAIISTSASPVVPSHHQTGTLQPLPPSFSSFWPWNYFSASPIVGSPPSFTDHHSYC